MARSREYDEDTVLTGAMHAFRRKGYSSVSIKDLESATGLKGGSIYNSYGDKAGLFDAAMDQYNRNVLCHRLVKFASAAAGIDGLRELFLSLLREPRGESFGCLITNAAVEFGGEEAIPGGVSEGLHTVMSTFLDRLTAAKETVTVGSDIDPMTEATKLLTLYQGTLVLVRAGWNKVALAKMINDAFDKLGEY